MRRKGLFLDYFEAAIIAVLLSLFVRTFLFEAYRIPTPSMESTLLVGDHIIVDKFSLGPRLDFEGGILPMRNVRHGDVVVFRFEREPEKDYVKRVIGLPGDEVKVDDKILYLNGKPVDEPYVQHIDSGTIPERDFLPSVKVPRGHYFVMGDNRDNSADSREWGFVPAGQVHGRAMFIYWSVAGQGATSVAARTRDDGGALGALSNTRWGRTFQAIR